MNADSDPATQINADPCGSGSGYGSGKRIRIRNPEKRHRKERLINWKHLNDLESGVSGDEPDHPLDDQAQEQRESRNVEVPLRPDTKVHASKAKK